MFHNVQRSETEHGVYKIDQVENSTLCGYRSKDRMPFALAAGIFAVSGSLHTTTQEIEVTLEVYKMNLGTLHGYANRGLKIDLDLNMVEGSIELRLTAFDELWLHIDTKVFQVTEDGSGEFIEYKKAHRIQEIPGITCAPWVSAGVNL
ncbi:hypothetical protein N7457_002323 [Penicillium paradoxum]|uniref:uncharacterized protein n=1 Tax=Penicillium paradoxum TaxID=176176 RepID=UPI002547D025|nr:uncharacterized protein N7457_002323 [Penicillium paradoxum]KAJ5787333.1 hypothetical protein N7457_002323 [Penicillium paradoxum]